MLENTSFTLADIVAICGLITSLAAVATIVMNISNKAKKPNEEQNKRIEALEKQVAEINVKLEKDKSSIHRLSEEVHLMLKADRALLEHGINGNNIEPMIRSQEEIDEYLIRK